MITQDKKIANHLNYIFSNLGEFFGAKKPPNYNKSASASAPFQFQHITVKQCFDIVRKINMLYLCFIICIFFHAQTFLSCARKTNDSYSDTINFMRTEISFALLRGAIICLRGYKKLQNTYIDNSITVINLLFLFQQ